HLQPGLRAQPERRELRLAFRKHGNLEIPGRRGIELEAIQGPSIVVVVAEAKSPQGSEMHAVVGGGDLALKMDALGLETEEEGLGRNRLAEIEEKEAVRAARQRNRIPRGISLEPAGIKRR